MCTCTVNFQLLQGKSDNELDEMTSEVNLVGAPSKQEREMQEGSLWRRRYPTEVIRDWNGRKSNLSILRTKDQSAPPKPSKEEALARRKGSKGLVLPATAATMQKLASN
eukprot:TRINITY_DN20878_c0_g1_i1.p1 TRINITY_DN20878_c0_g1~~TRINITY_DN20878_c0_g1_i1.p1  ORF type:complete len:109 (+),score=16.24 TRINITY_DN20878_c0_g1_i1:83-409(+)